MPFCCIDLQVPPSCRTEWNKLTCQTFTSFPRCCRRHKQLWEEDWSCRSVPYRWCTRSVDGPDISARRALTAELTTVANNQINLFRCNDGAIARADTLIFYEFTHSFFSESISFFDNYWLETIQHTPAIKEAGWALQNLNLFLLNFLFMPRQHSGLQ